jgi:hypothetical protein
MTGRAGTGSRLAIGLLVLLAAALGGCGDDSDSTQGGQRVRVALCVAAEQADAHARPSADSEVVGQVMVASNVWADSVTGEWWRIEHEGRHVWLHRSLVDTGHLPQALVVHRQASAIEGLLQQRAEQQESDLEKLRKKVLSGE